MRAVVANGSRGVECDVLAYGAREQPRVLGQVADEAAALVGRQLSEGPSADPNRSRGERIHAENGASERGLPRPDGTGHRDQRPSRNLEVERAKRGPIGSRVLKGHPAEGQREGSGATPTWRRRPAADPGHVTRLEGRETRLAGDAQRGC